MKVSSFARLGIVAIIFLSIIFFSSIVNYLTDWWWFSEVNYSEIFLKTITMKLLIGIATGLFVGLFLLANFSLAIKTKIPWIGTIPAALFGQELSIKDTIAMRLAFGVSTVIGVFMGLVASSYWMDVLKFLSATPFNQKDPLFNLDISFYIFTLPVVNTALGILKFVIIVALVGTLLVSLLKRSFHLEELLSVAKIFSKKTSLQSDHPTTNHFTRMHIGILASLFLLVTAVTTYLSLYELLLTPSGSIFGAAFTDTTISIPLLQITAAVYLLATLFALVYGFTGKISPLVFTFGLTVVLGIVSAVVPPVVQRFIVAPNELVKETPYIKKHIEATRTAYNLQNVEKRKINADQPLTPEIINANSGTIKNVRLWDRDPLLSTFSQIQEIRTYYEFASVDNDRYMLNGELRQVMLSPRELQSESLPNRNWINERLTFTHGYGIAAGPVNQVTPEGLPVLFVKNLPPVTEVKELEVKRPELYFGEITNNYVIVKSNSREFNYPKGEENVYAKYEGTGGVQLDSLLKRILYAFQFNELKMVLSGDITNDSRIIYNRNVKERVEKIAPFLTFDRDPYMVVSDGKLYWILDAYTLSDRYPYAEQLTTQNGSVNYIRNSVKAVVDAYNGNVTFYLADSQDPIIKTYTKIFPTSFKSMENMPKGLIAHLRYPEDIFALQTSIYTTYHMDDPQLFYNKEDQWEVPGVGQVSGQTTAKEATMTPRHMIMKLPNESEEEFILMLPFTPRAKDNLSAWMVARNDGDNYGKLVVYSFPKDKLVFGPKQIMGRINQDAEVSRQIALWDQRGSQVIQGPLLVIPIEESLVYVRPLYLKAETGKIPELKRVIVAYENKIAMEETLEKGLARIFGTDTNQNETNAGKPVPTGTPQQSTTSQTDQSLLKQANDAYNAATEAQKNGDWARYGEELTKLGEILKQLQ